MTEEEAKTKWCPQVRLVRGVGHGETATANPSDIPKTRCIGSDCMMWRIDKHPFIKDENNDVGYCGLAGKP